MRWVAIAAALGASALATGCSVTPLPPSTPAQAQTPVQQKLDRQDCAAEAGSRTDYSPSDSPMANLFRRVFFWGTAGAALGGTIDGLPTSVNSEASTGLIVGASTGGAVGVAASLGGQPRFERAWVACMRERGYAIETMGGAGARAAGEGRANDGSQ